MNNLRNVKPVLMFVSILSFIVSLIFTVKLLSSQATTGADRALFGGLAISAEIGKVILFSIGMMLIFVFRRRRYSWLGVPLLLISLSFTVLSVVGTMGALQVGNAEKTETSSPYLLKKTEIENTSKLIWSKEKIRDGYGAALLTKKNTVNSEIERLMEKNKQAQIELEKLSKTGTGAHNALYATLANWTGETIEHAKFVVMASYGIGLEALALFCALFAFFGDYLLGNKKAVVEYADYEEIPIDKPPSYWLNLRNQAENKLMEIESRKVKAVPELASLNSNQDLILANFPNMEKFIDILWWNVEEKGKDHLTGTSKMGKLAEIEKGEILRYSAKLKELGLISVDRNGGKAYTFPNVRNKNEMLTELGLDKKNGGKDA